MSNSIKDILRISSLQIRANITSSYQYQASQQICQQIGNTTVYRQAKHIALYQAFNQEIDLSDIWRKAPLQGKYCYFPAITEQGDLVFLPATPKTIFVKNKYGIAEPMVARQEAIAPEKLDIIFMPLVGFDIFGTRLGMGKGYYDKSLSAVKTGLKIGLAYELQKMDYIPPDAWDIPLDIVITESEIYTFD